MMQPANVSMLRPLWVGVLENPCIAKLRVRHVDGRELLSFLIIHCLLFEIQFCAANDQSLYLARSLINFCDLRIAEISPHWKFFAVTHPAMNLHGGVRAEHRSFGGK